MPVSFVRPSDRETTLYCSPATAGVVSWNARAPEGELSLRVRFADAYRSAWLPYVAWSPRKRRSFSARDEEVTIETDTVRTRKPFVSLEARASGRLDALALATPDERSPRAASAAGACDLAVPAISQYAVEGERGWCSPAALTMLLRFHGRRVELDAVAAAVYDEGYRGTGNWAFNVAYAATFGLRAFVAYLRDFAHVRSFLERGLPPALSYAWEAGQLTGAPLERSDGHLAVVRGFDEAGDPILNDPAHPEVRVTYARAELEALWLQHGGVAYVIAPTSGADPVALVNEDEDP